MSSSYENALNSCRFFEKNLRTVGSDRTTLPPCTGILSAPTSEQLLADLQTAKLEYKLKHQRYCRDLKNKAREAMQLTETFLIVSSNVDQETLLSSSSSTSQLQALHLGDDTTIALKRKIAEFAGVPSESDLEDWVVLHSLLK